MDLHIKNKNYIVLGATGGFGYAITKTLYNEGAKIIINARDENKINSLVEKHKPSITGITGDITNTDIIKKLILHIKDLPIEGIVINAGGPPAGSFDEIPIEYWDNAYKSILRWKVQILKELIPKFLNQGSGHIVFIESISVKQPVENLILSNSLRMAVVGLVKTLANKYAASGITLNILAPGYHETNALKRVIRKKADTTQNSYENAKILIENAIPMKQLGNPEDLSTLAVWLLSPLSKYVTGKTFSIDGGIVTSVFG